MEVLLDTGPLVALLQARDTQHAWAVQAFGDLSGTLLTCEAVLTEASYLLRHDRRGMEHVFRQVEAGRLQVASLAGHQAEVGRLMSRYASVPMSYADACLVRLSELHPDCMVLTLDSDFHVYRRLGRRLIPQRTPRAR